MIYYPKGTTLDPRGSEAPPILILAVLRIRYKAYLEGSQENKGCAPAWT